MTISVFRWIDKYELLKRIRRSVFDFTNVFANMELERGYVLAERLDGLNDDVTAIIGFNGDYEGTVWVRCSELLAGRIASGMWGTGSEPTNDNVSDALGEMINIIGGEIKLFLSPGGKEVRLSLPSVFQKVSMGVKDLKGHNEDFYCSFFYLGEPLHVGMTMRKQYKQTI